METKESDSASGGSERKRKVEQTASDGKAKYYRKRARVRASPPPCICLRVPPESTQPVCADEGWICVSTMHRSVYGESCGEDSSCNYFMQLDWEAYCRLEDERVVSFNADWCFLREPESLIDAIMIIAAHLPTPKRGDDDDTETTAKVEAAAAAQEAGAAAAKVEVAAAAQEAGVAGSDTEQAAASDKRVDEFVVENTGPRTSMWGVPDELLESEVKCLEKHGVVCTAWKHVPRNMTFNDMRVLKLICLHPASVTDL